MPEKEQRRSGAVWVDLVFGMVTYFHLPYLCDGESNQLRFAPRPGMADVTVKLADVNEDLVRFWYWRDIDDFRKYQHKGVRYELWSGFNPDDPQVAQISRVLVNPHGHPIEEFRQLMCLYCQDPTFSSVRKRQLESHVCDYHLGSERICRTDVRAVVSDLMYGKGVTSSIED